MFHLIFVNFEQIWMQQSFLIVFLIVFPLITLSKYSTAGLIVIFYTDNILEHPSGYVL